MTCNALIAEIARHPVDERVSLFEALRCTLSAEFSLATFGLAPHRLVASDDVPFPDDPALAALEAQFE